jgi:tRNA/rRNA methyltransferase
VNARALQNNTRWVNEDKERAATIHHESADFTGMNPHTDPAPQTAPPSAPPSASKPEPSPTAPPDPTRFVLIGTSHAGNVGAAARAMKVMGFADLVLVAPRFADVLTHDDAQAMASGALDVLANARVVSSLTEALDGITHACATAMTPRDFGPATFAPRPHFASLAGSAHRVAMVFGPERTGLSNDDVYRCHSCLSIPAHPDYGSLNLAQAVQLLAYDWRQALGGYAVTPRTTEPNLADGAAIAGLLSHWQETLQNIGFLDPAAPKKLMPRLNQLLNRSQLTKEEIHILRGIARCIDKLHNKPPA